MYVFGFFGLRASARKREAILNEQPKSKVDNAQGD